MACVWTLRCLCALIRARAWSLAAAVENTVGGWQHGDNFSIVWWLKLIPTLHFTCDSTHAFPTPGSEMGRCVLSHERRTYIIQKDRGLEPEKLWNVRRLLCECCSEMKISALKKINNIFWYDMAQSNDFIWDSRSHPVSALGKRRRSYSLDKRGQVPLSLCLQAYFQNTRWTFLSPE